MFEHIFHKVKSSKVKSILMSISTCTRYIEESRYIHYVKIETIFNWKIRRRVPQNINTYCGAKGP